jgi:MoaD family protein
MARVRVMFQAMFREIVGKREIIQEISNGYTLRDLLNFLAETYGKDFKDVVDPKTGNVDNEVWILINGKSIRKTDVKLNDNEVVFIGVPIGGG